MAPLEATKKVNASPERVWQIITDLEGSQRVITGIIDIERLDGGRTFGVGTRWRETRKMMGKTATEEMTVTAVDPGRSYHTRAGNSKVEYESTMFVLPSDGGAIVGMSFSGEPKTTGGKIMAATIGRLFAGATRKMMVKDLEDIAAFAEAK